MHFFTKILIFYLHFTWIITSFTISILQPFDGIKKFLNYKPIRRLLRSTTTTLFFRQMKIATRRIAHALRNVALSRCIPYTVALSATIVVPTRRKYLSVRDNGRSLEPCSKPVPIGLRLFKEAGSQIRTALATITVPPRVSLEFARRWYIAQIPIIRPGLNNPRLIPFAPFFWPRSSFAFYLLARLARYTGADRVELIRQPPVFDTVDA